MTHRDAARARYTADQHSQAAIVARAAGRDVEAEQLDQQAATCNAYATLMIDLENAKATGDRVALHTMKHLVMAFRSDIRNGTQRPGVIDHITEPTDQQLTELGY